MFINSCDVCRDCQFVDHTIYGIYAVRIPIIPLARFSNIRLTPTDALPRVYAKPPFVQNRGSEGIMNHKKGSPAHAMSPNQQPTAFQRDPPTWTAQRLTIQLHHRGSSPHYSHKRSPCNFQPHLSFASAPVILNQRQQIQGGYPSIPKFPCPLVCINRTEKEEPE